MNRAMAIEIYKARNCSVRMFSLFLVLVLTLLIGVQLQPQLALNRFLLKYVVCVASDYAANSEACTESAVTWDDLAHLLQNAKQTNIAFWAGHYVLCQQGDESRVVTLWRPIAREAVFRIFASASLFECGEIEPIAIARRLNASTSTVDYFTANQLLSAGQPDQAAVYYERALQRDDFDKRLPGKEKSFWALARHHINHQNWDQAISILESSLLVCRDCWTSHYLMGLSHRNSGGTSEIIIHHLAEAQRLNPRWGGTYRILLEELIAAQRYAEAKAVVQQGLIFVSPKTDTYQYLLEIQKQLPDNIAPS